jgi:FAD/FMN-containing dehydrogenase
LTELAGWGRYPRHESELLSPATAESSRAALAAASGIVARGNGRAYGDAAIGQRTTLATRGLDRMRAFDPATSRLTVEAGVLLGDILEAFVPRGLFPPVVPGTKFVTVGGMIASDVHGKNHHRDGGFGSNVDWLRLALPGGEVVTCSPGEDADLFWATVGGMGLTGTILEAAFRLKPIETGWMRQETVVASDLDEAMAALVRSDGFTYSVAWIDCLARGASLGRSLVYMAEHATLRDLEELGPKPDAFPPARSGRLAIPIDFPAFALTRPTVAAFNALYFRNGARQAGRPFLVGWDPYFFPLDGIASWNRMYGRRGFVQHQCVIPDAVARQVLGDLLERISGRGNASFLAVLKRLGASSGTMSFPFPGYTLALDLQVDDNVFGLLDEVDRIVVEAGGRLYLAKDARQSRQTFEAGYPGLQRFRELRRAIGAEGRIVSRQSARLGI